MLAHAVRKMYHKQNMIKSPIKCSFVENKTVIQYDIVLHYTPYIPKNIYNIFLLVFSNMCTHMQPWVSTGLRHT